MIENSHDESAARIVDYAAFAALSPTTLADVMSRDRVMNIHLRPLWLEMPRIAGPAYPVRCPRGDNLMLHAAIHRAPRGAVIVVQAGDVDFAVAGGNVCGVAHRRGIAGFVVDGVVRDLAEIRGLRFPVFARGVVPIPGAKNEVDVLDGPIECGGVHVEPGDVVVADEEGIVVVPNARAAAILADAEARAQRDAAETLDAWEAAHRAKVDEILKRKGFER